ncbi:MAG: hypothetical protein RL291_1771, partial [Pseudomonadota bacterium]
FGCRDTSETPMGTVEWRTRYCAPPLEKSCPSCQGVYLLSSRHASACPGEQPSPINRSHAGQRIDRPVVRRHVERYRAEFVACPHLLLLLPGSCANARLSGILTTRCSARRRLRKANSEPGSHQLRVERVARRSSQQCCLPSCSKSTGKGAGSARSRAPAGEQVEGSWKSLTTHRPSTRALIRVQ